ncbi:MAG: DUF3160 domain-containing protein [bacterium]|nr:DUF3160 domain-containing protein [bacterium]
MGIDTHDVRGYVEPVLELWTRLLSQVQSHRRILMAAGYYSDDLADVFLRYEEMVVFCKTATEKQLAGIELNAEEYEWLRWFGAKVERWTLDILSLDQNIPIYDRRYDGQTYDSTLTMKDVWLKSWYQVTGPDRDLACVADVANSGELCLEEAVGHLDEVYIVVPIGGELRMTRGAVFSYMNFNMPLITA